MPTSAENQQYPSPDYPFPGFPPEFSPLRTGRPGKVQRSLTPPTKFVKAGNRAIPNRYIVVLNDDVVASNAPLETRRDRIETIANSHARTHLGVVGAIYETALKGYSIELPNEAAAIAISKNRNVKWVEEDALFEFAQEIQPDGVEAHPPWGLDAIDQGFPVGAPNANGTNNGLYVYNTTGAGVVAYVLDSGINRMHSEFGPFFSRVSQAADCFRYANCQSGTIQFLEACPGSMPNANNNDCTGHGTHVAGTLGGNLYGVAKLVTIKSVKVGGTWGAPESTIINGVNFVTNDHLANPDVPAVANMSVGFYNDPNNPFLSGIDTAVLNSINSGVTYVIAAGNDNANSNDYVPADVAAALTIGAVDWTGQRWAYSNWGSGVDLFAPGVNVLSALTGSFMSGCLWDGISNNSTCVSSGTSFASPHVAGAVAMYLESRTGQSQCAYFPIQLSAPPGDAAACPDRVTRFIKANAILNQLSNVNGVSYPPPNGDPVAVPSANRFVWTTPIPAAINSNPIDNQRFFVWQQYADFAPLHYITHLPQTEPDEGGLDWWTNEIIGHGHCSGVGVNDNNACTDLWRVLTSRAFFVATHESWFNSSYGLAPSNDPSHADANERFIREAYMMYLRRPADTSGFNFWYNDLLTWGNPANQDGVLHMVSAFVHSGVPDGYRQRFGRP
jgi:hypothetical protein